MKTTRRQFLKTSAAIGITGSINHSEIPDAKNVSFHPSFPAYCNAESGLQISKIESFTGQNHTFVKVTSNDGSSGFGQVANYHNDITTTVLHNMIAQRMIGMDPYTIADSIESCIEANYKFPWSFVCRAAAGVETALWDLKGKREQKSVVELIGGKPKAIPAYASSMSRSIKPKEEAERLKKLGEEKGFRACKIRVGKVNGHDEDQWPGRTEELIPTVKKGVGNNMEIFADGNSCYTPKKAIEVGKLLEANEGKMFEEPCPFWELEWTAKVTQALKMNVSGGEQDNDMAQWKRMINMDVVDVVQPDVCYLGGISRTLKVAQMAAEVGKTCVPHSANLSLITVFALHLMAAIENAAPFLEYSIEDTPWAKDLYQPYLRIENGNVMFPEGPGWGVDVNEAWLNKAKYQKTEA